MALDGSVILGVCVSDSGVPHLLTWMYPADRAASGTNVQTGEKKPECVNSSVLCVHVC